MAQPTENYSLPDWLLTYQALNFMEKDVQSILDQLALKMAGSHYFQFLEGSNRSSPRFRCKEGNCVILQYLGNHRFLARTYATSRTLNKIYDKEAKKNIYGRLVSDHFVFLVFDESLPVSQGTKEVFTWTVSMVLRDSPQRRLHTAKERSWLSSEVKHTTCPRGAADGRVEGFPGLSPSSHFESYASCRKRFVVVAGPPCLNCGNFSTPSGCIFDAQKTTMKIFRLDGLQTDEKQDEVWPANVVFDPRPYREHVASVIACPERFHYLPRSGQTGSLVLFDFRKQEILHVLTNKLCFSTDLQFTCSGDQLLTSAVDDDVKKRHLMTSPADILLRRSLRILLLSSENLSLLRVLPVLPPAYVKLPFVVTSVTSCDLRHVALFLWKCREGSERASSSSYRSTDHQSAKAEVDVALISFPLNVRSLQHLCLSTIGKWVRNPDAVDSLPIPKALALLVKKADVLDNA